MKKSLLPIAVPTLLLGLGSSGIFADDIQIDAPDGIQISPQKSGDSDEIDLGDMTIDVVRSLGTPKGQMDNEAERRKLLYYPRGLVDIKDDRVFEFKLLTQQQLEAKIRRIEEERLAKEKEIAELHALMLVEAAEEISKIKADENFELQPAAKRVAYWKTFQRKYPGAPLDDESWQKAMVEYNATEERRAMEQELERLRQEAEENDPGPKPKLSSKKIKRLKRAGQWKWGEKDEDEK